MVKAYSVKLALNRNIPERVNDFETVFGKKTR